MSDSDLQQPVEKARSPFSEAWDMFRRNYAAVAGLIVLILITIGAIIGPVLYPTDPYEMVWAPFSPPGEEGFLLGKTLFNWAIFRVTHPEK